MDYLALDRLDERTLDWFHGQRRAVALAAGERPPATPDETRAFLESQAEALADADADGAADGEPVPILHRWLGSESAALERTLIDVGAIAAVGVRRP